MWRPILQVWMTEKKWNMDEDVDLVTTDPPTWMYKDMNDTQGYYWEDKILTKLSKKIELAIGYNVTARWAASKYQVRLS